MDTDSDSSSTIYILYFILSTKVDYHARSISPYSRTILTNGNALNFARIADLNNRITFCIDYNTWRYICRVRMVLQSINS